MEDYIRRNLAKAQFTGNFQSEYPTVLNATKEWYVSRENIRHSDCYEVYGLQRTGCVGCPFGKDVFEELEIMQKYEPKCYKLCMNVFGESYELKKKYREFVATEKQEQRSLFD